MGAATAGQAGMMVTAVGVGVSCWCAMWLGDRRRRRASQRVKPLFPVSLVLLMAAVCPVRIARTGRVYGCGCMVVDPPSGPGRERWGSLVGGVL